MMKSFAEHADRAAPPVIRIVDDNAATCESLRFFLEALGFETEVWTDPTAFLEAVQERREQGAGEPPGCLLLDIRMPSMSGLELLDRLNDAGYRVPIIFLTGHGEVEMAVRALKRGAFDFLLKPPEEERLVEAVEAAVEKHRALLDDQAERARKAGLWASLTDREKDVMRWVAKGSMNKQIAAELDIAEKTVQQHRGAACRKLCIRSAVEAAAFLRALEIGSGFEREPDRQRGKTDRTQPKEGGR